MNNIKFNINNFTLSNNDKNIINNIDNKKCYYEKTFVNYHTINGFSESIDRIDYTYLVPNLFRLCYVQTTLSVPNVCVKYLVNNVIYNYFPILLDEIYIKSFLYFNFPASYKNVSYINYFVNNIINLENYVLKKSYSTTYGSITSSEVVYSAIYDNNSMLSQLLYLAQYIEKSTVTYANEKVDTPFYVKWDYITGCVKDIYDNTYFIGPYNYNNVINCNSAQFLNFIKNSFFNIFPENDILNYNDILIVYKYSINKIVGYALEVYQDILVQINYFLTCKQYCNRDYMNINNIPILFALYNNFYKNQIYTVNNYLQPVNPQNATPYRITLEQYINNFILYYETNDLGIVIKTVYLNNDEGFIFCYKNERTRKNYQYFYINIISPSPVELYNFWGTTGPTPDYTGKSVEDFSDDFLYKGYLTIEPYLTSSGSKSAKLTGTYNDGGLYESVLGLTYNTYNDITSTKINSSIYLTFESDLGIPIGLPLVYYKKYN